MHIASDLREGKDRNMTSQSVWRIASENRDLLTFSTYFMANEFERYLASDEDIDEVIRVCKGYGIPRIYLETFRDGFQPSRSVVARARDRLQEAGFEVTAAICTTRYGEPGTALTLFPCLTSERSRQELADMFTFTASLFDTILIDEYIWSHCQCEQCQAAKGDRTWTEFRCDQLRQVCRGHVIAPARRVNPKVQLFYKFPAMYEQLARQGQDIDYMLEDFDGIWIGTEVGPFTESPQNMLRSQGPYRAFFLMRWMREMGKDKLGGSWIMPLQDSGHLLDTAYQTILGEPRELVLHPYGGIGPRYHWALPGGEGQFPTLLKDAPELFKLARIVRENPARGLVAARPARAEPWEFGKAYDANVFDYVGQIGIPLRPVRDFPEDAEGFFLSLHTRSLSSFGEKIERLRHTTVPILVTDGLASTLDESFLDRPNVFVVDASVSTPSVFDYRGFTDPYDLALRLRPVSPEKAWDALSDDTGWDISMRYTSDVQMAAKIFGMPPSWPELLMRRLQESGQRLNLKHLPLDELRSEILKPFGISLRGPIRVSVHPLGEDYLVLHNFNEHLVKMWLKSETSPDIQPVVTLPTTSKTVVNRVDEGFENEIDPHTLTCFKLGKLRQSS